VSSLVLTRFSRSSDIDWSVSMFCQCKTCKRDKILHKITSNERTKRLLNIATLTDDGEMVHRITNDGFA
jgi:predicted MarR family transcription regulator